MVSNSFAILVFGVPNTALSGEIKAPALPGVLAGIAAALAAGFVAFALRRRILSQKSQRVQYSLAAKIIVR